MGFVIQSVQGTQQIMENPHFFGIRHLSPAASVELKSFLDETKPLLVLVEGPSDLNAMIDSICNPKVKFPIAIMAYSKNPPVRSILYPFAEYSPEIQALLWAKKNGAKAEFMDLPSSTFLAIPEEDESEDENESENGESNQSNLGITESVYSKLEILTGESHDSWWERNFEQLACTGKYREAANAFGREMRKAEVASGKRDFAETLVREAFMKRKIEDAVKSGIPCEKIVCVCGAFHVGGLEANSAMSDDEMKNLPSVESSSTLLPYSFFRLSNASGYGAGNSSPSYFQKLYKTFCNIKEDSSNKDELMKKFAIDYLVSCAENQRKSGNILSSASVIEATRLSLALAKLRGSAYPNLQDFHDAMTSTLTNGNFSEIVSSVAKVEVQSVIGFLPEGMSQTAVQDDFNRQLEILKLSKFKTEIESTLELDLREKLSAKSEEIAFRDLYRSFFFNRLSVLKISFAIQCESNQSNMNWKEVWSLKWTPQTEMEVVEASVNGDTIASACSLKIREMVDNSPSIEEATRVFKIAFLCGLPDLCNYALKKVQGFSTEDNALLKLAETAEELSFVVRYGDLRKFDSSPLLPMLEKLYLRSVLIMEDSCVCDDEHSSSICAAIDKIHNLQLNHKNLDENLILEKLNAISAADYLDCYCSGFALSILLERGKCDEEFLLREISRRLSKGTPADLASRWFEGLSAKNHYTLLARLQVWKQINQYIQSLDDEEFTRSLVVLRRTFSDFTQNEKCDISENLGEVWGFNKNEVSEFLTKEFSESEQKKIDALGDFDFDDI